VLKFHVKRLAVEGGEGEWKKASGEEKKISQKGVPLFPS
jgi:hypothetical protein